MKVAVLGASPKPERYSYQAIKMLLECGFEVVPVNPAYDQIAGLEVVKYLSLLDPASVDTVTVYVGSKHILKFQKQLVDLAPRRVIFNPGTESEQLKGLLSSKGVEVLEACTLVLLKTGQFAP